MFLIIKIMHDYCRKFGDSKEMGRKLNPLIIVSLWYTPANILVCFLPLSLKRKKGRKGGRERERERKAKVSFSPPYLPVPLPRAPCKIILMAISISANNVFIPVFLDLSVSRKIYFCPLWKKEFSSWPNPQLPFTPLLFLSVVFWFYMIIFSSLVDYLYT